MWIFIGRTYTTNSPSCKGFLSAASWKHHPQATESFGRHHHTLLFGPLESYNFRICSAGKPPLGRCFEQSIIEIKEPSITNRCKYSVSNISKRKHVLKAYKNVLSHHQRRFDGDHIRLRLLYSGHLEFRMISWTGFLSNRFLLGAKKWQLTFF